MEESTLKSGGTVWISGGYSYIRERERGDKVYLKCRHRKTCTGRARVKLSTLKLHETKSHCCSGALGQPE